MSLPFPELCPSGSEFVQTESGAFCYSNTDKRPVECPPGAITTPLQGGSVFCTGPDGSVGKQCPTGYRLYYGVDSTGEECRKATPATCPAGTTLYAMFKKGANGQPEGGAKQVCVPNTAASYSRPMPTSQTAPWPCDGNDPAALDGTGGIKCFGSGSSGSTSSQPPSPPSGTFDELNAQYKRQVKEYEDEMMAALQTNAPSRVPGLRAKAESIQATLTKMVESLTFMKKETNDIRVQRDKLLEDMRRIQRDYSAMLVNTDDLETLRRIRQQESGEARRQLNLYLLAFLFVAMALLVYIVFKGRKEEASSASAPTPTMSPALT